MGQHHGAWGPSDPMKTTLWGRGSHRGRRTLKAHGDSAMGQRYGAGGPSEHMGTALWGRGSHRDSAMGQEDQWGVGTVLWGSTMGEGAP